MTKNLEAILHGDQADRGGLIIDVAHPFDLGVNAFLCDLAVLLIGNNVPCLVS